jgi:hypothetical protein
LPDGPGRFPQGSSCPAVLRSRLGEVRAFAYRAVTSCGRPFQAVRLALAFPFVGGPATPGFPCGVARFGLLRFRSPLLSKSRLFSSPPGTEMVHFPGFASHGYEFTARWPAFAPAGFPHSDIPGSQLACNSPGLFAAGRVLLRLLAPRHPHARP